MFHTLNNKVLNNTGVQTSSQDFKFKKISFAEGMNNEYLSVAIKQVLVVKKEISKPRLLLKTAAVLFWVSQAELIGL